MISTIDCTDAGMLLSYLSTYVNIIVRMCVSLALLDGRLSYLINTLGGRIFTERKLASDMMLRMCADDEKMSLMF